jgi:hypothetical protein
MEPGQPLKVELSVNGHSLPFLETIERWLKFSDQQVEQVAAMMCKEKASVLLDRFHALIEKSEKAFHDEFEKTFPNYRGEQ